MKLHGFFKQGWCSLERAQSPIIIISIVKLFHLALIVDERLIKSGPSLFPFNNQGKAFLVFLKIIFFLSSVLPSFFLSFNWFDFLGIAWQFQPTRVRRCHSSESVDLTWASMCVQLPMGSRQPHLVESQSILIVSTAADRCLIITRLFQFAKKQNKKNVISHDFEKIPS